MLNGSSQWNATQQIHWYTQQHGIISNTWKAKLKRIHTVWFYIHGALEKVKLPQKWTLQEWITGRQKLNSWGQPDAANREGKCCVSWLPWTLNAYAFVKIQSKLLLLTFFCFLFL
jgi:hypothetical protein